MPYCSMPSILRLRALSAIAASVTSSSAFAGQGTIVHQAALPTLSGGLGSFQMQGLQPPGQSDTFPISVTVPQFSPCPDVTLTGVRVTLTASTSGGCQTSCQPGVTTVVTGRLLLQANLAGAGLSAQGSSASQTGGPVTLSSSNGHQAFFNLSPGTVIATIDREVLASAVPQYVGSGTASFGGAFLFGQSGSASPSPVTIQFFRTTAASLTVTYTFITPPADLNGDRVVDGSDLGALLAEWGSKAPGAADLDGSGSVDGLDLGVLLAEWGSSGCS